MKKDGKDQDKRENGSMASTFEEMKEHGKIMEHVSSNEQVKKSGKTPDPQQLEHDQDDN
ncbi:hypothetical protein ACFQPF_14975 [Fictibacillus iocasae]|uniref:DUF4025 domain-containing protein n=1 Tax=Fictibacillus iocasae TaxID=2715437 RepID=A0ABW2NSX6_9BACL